MTDIVYFRIIQRIIGTKLYLNKLKISDDKHCSICLHMPESIAFTDIVIYLHIYYLYEKQMFDTDVF